MGELTVKVEFDRKEIAKLVREQILVVNEDEVRAIATNTVCEVLDELTAGQDKETQFRLREKFTLIGPKVVKAMLEYHGATNDTRTALLDDAGNTAARREVESGG
jgi:hypothetical protein